MKRIWILLFLAAGVMLAGTTAIGRELGDFRQWTWLTMTLSVVGGSLVLAAAWAWRNETVGYRWLLAVALLGIAMRLLVLPATWELSDDAPRYHWDGKALAHGVNPYMHAPDEPAVAHLWTDAVDERINHPWNRTCYPPAAEGVFALGYLISPGSLRGLQYLSLIAEILTWVILARELARRRRSRAWLLLMIWSPLLICQGYLPGHVDMYCLPFVALLVCAVLAGQAGRAGLWLAVACLIKPLPLFFLPAILREFGLRRSGRVILVFGLVLILGYMPFRQAGWLLFSSTWLMATDWSFNGSFGAVFEALLPPRRAHLLSAILIGIGVLVTAWRGRDFLARAIGAHIVFVIFTPTLYPWYLVSTLPLLVLRPQAALLGLGVLAPLSDQVVIAHHLQGLWREAAWVRWVQYLPFYGLLAWEGWRDRRWWRRS